jgi:DNA (cytosine-5)-methyltransferase 1
MEKFKFTYIDLFAGCGGLSLGLHNAGWKGLFAIEKSPFAFQTLKFNLISNTKHFSFPKWIECKEHDIDEIIGKHETELKSLQGQIDLVAGGPPCQGFSMAGKRIEEDKRNKLVYSYIKFIELVKPKLILFENVKGFTYAFKTEKGQSLPHSAIVISRLQEIGYDVKAQVIDFSNFGVPQRRKRFILIGSLSNNADTFMKLINIEKDSFLKTKGLNSYITVSEAISDLLLQSGYQDSPDRKRFNTGLFDIANSPFQILMRNGSSRLGEVADSHSFAKHSIETQTNFLNLLQNYPTRNKRIGDKERVKWNIKKRGVTILDKDSISPTLTTHPDDYIHYSEPRILTVREYARLQTFPDWYEIKGKYTTGGNLRKFEVPRYTQIGNAIPPLFAELAGLALKKML